MLVNVHQPAPVTRYGASGRHPSSAAGATFAFPTAWAYTDAREDEGAVLHRIIGLVLVTLAVSATASAQGLKPGETFRDCPECPEMVVIPAGNFTMGSPANEPGRYDDEGPRHRVTIPRGIVRGKWITLPARQIGISPPLISHGFPGSIRADPRPPQVFRTFL